MRKVIVGALTLCVSASAYATSSHDAHMPAASDAKTVQHVSKGHDSGAVLSKSLTISNCWIRSLPGPTPSAGYFVIKNTGANEATLIALSIPNFDQVSLHQTIDQDGMSRMAVADEIPIPAGGQLQFKPGGYHAMLEQPSRKLTVGTEVEGRFTFQSGEVAKAMCAVKPASAISG